MLGFHVLGILRQRPRHRNNFYLMKPLIKSCGFTNNWLTFKITSQIKSLMPKFVNLMLCSENHPPFNILSHWVLNILQPSSAHSCSLHDPNMWIQHCPGFYIRDLNSSRFNACAALVFSFYLCSVASVSDLGAAHYCWVSRSLELYLSLVVNSSKAPLVL